LCFPWKACPRSQNREAGKPSRERRAPTKELCHSEDQASILVSKERLCKDPKETAQFAATPKVNQCSGFKKAHKRHNRETKFSL